jgi:hypothetical protein
MAKFSVRKIISTVGDYSRVTLDSETFRAVQGFKPELPYKAMGTADGKGVRVFDLDGVEIMSAYDGEARKTMFFMKNSDASKHLSTLSDERSTEEKLPISLSAFAE